MDLNPKHRGFVVALSLVVFCTTAGSFYLGSRYSAQPLAEAGWRVWHKATTKETAGQERDEGRGASAAACQLATAAELAANRGPAQRIHTSQPAGGAGAQGPPLRQGAVYAPDSQLPTASSFGISSECCSLDGCSSSLLIQHFASLNKTRVAGEKQCPEKYITFTNYGRFNNELMNVIRVLVLGAIFNRTVLIPADRTADGNPMLQMDLSSFCTVHEKQVNITRLGLENGHPVRAFTGIRDAHRHIVFTLARWYVSLDLGPVRNKIRSSHLLCVAAMIPSSLPDLLIAYPVPFYLQMSQSLSRQMLGLVRFSEEVTAVAERFVRATLGSRPFVAVHLRSFNGKCHAKMDHFFKGNAFANASCDMDWPFVSALIKAGGFDPNGPIFLASDGKNPEKEAQLTARPNVHKLRLDKEEAELVHPSLLDEYICTRSSLFLGNSVSSMSINIALWREAHGHPPSTNVIAGYNETGLFLGYEEH